MTARFIRRFGLFEACASQELGAAVVDARGHAKAVQFYFMQPLRPGRRLFDRLGKLRRDEVRKGRVALASARRAGLESSNA
jgi:hypothetical protein